MNAIDTNIFVYLYDFEEPLKQQRAKSFIDQLIVGDEFVVPWQVVGEFLRVLRKWKNKEKISQQLLEQNFSSFLDLAEIVLPIPEIIQRSLDLYSSFQLSHWDSLLIAACIEAGVTTLYSEDMSHEAQYDTVQVLNPFLLPSSNQP